MRWAVFCRVIDNFGDAGICWRLVSELSQRGESVILWIDQPDILEKLIDPRQRPEHVVIQTWPADTETFSSADVADVVIEAFACDPPVAYVDAMAQRAASGHPPVWINLEYLSAEDWVGEHHRLPSPHPRHALVKHFYFPGFTPESGGLLRGTNLSDPVSASSGLLQSGQPLRIFLFGYAQPALSDWIRAQQNTVISVAPCPLADQLANTGQMFPADCSIRRLPFVPQSAFDAVLDAHDLLFVRGEDSFVRAQWAAKPVFWQIYPQDAEAHIVKLRAFYAHYLDPALLDPEMREQFLNFILAWNGSGHPGLCGSLWPSIITMLPSLQQNALNWRQRLLKQPDLVTQLRAFVADLVK